jgi:MFS family permease
MCLAVVLVAASVSALNLALPSIAVDLNGSDTDLTWIADAYTVALAALVLPLVAIGDRVGRRRVLVVGTVLFAAASLGASFAHAPHALIALRAVMGVAAAAIIGATALAIAVGALVYGINRGWRHRLDCDTAVGGIRRRRGLGALVAAAPRTDA